jgi:hypothetical protein
MRGRVLGMVTALALSASPLGVLICGYLLELIGLQTTLVGLAVSFLIMALSTIFNKSLRQLAKPTT